MAYSQTVKSRYVIAPSQKAVISTCWKAWSGVLISEMNEIWAGARHTVSSSSLPEQLVVHGKNIRVSFQTGNRPHKSIWCCHIDRGSKAPVTIFRNYVFVFLKYGHCVYSTGWGCILWSETWLMCAVLWVRLHGATSARSVDALWLMPC